jgi:Oxysterol-binding protein
MGKSFEIRPTGVAHADLKLPPVRGPSYPQGEGEDSDKVIEHYSWKKVTTSVSGFILGSPTIDHYGDMTVRWYPLSVKQGSEDVHRLSIIEPRILVSSPSNPEAGERKIPLRSKVT